MKSGKLRSGKHTDGTSENLVGAAIEPINDLLASVDSMPAAGKLEVNIEGTDVEALNEIFSGDAKRFKEYLLTKIKDRETITNAVKSD